MKKRQKIIINILLILFLIILIPFSFGWQGYLVNLIIFFALLILFIFFNTEKLWQINKKYKKVIYIILILLIVIIILLPKKNIGCYAPVGGSGCTTHYCVGLPIKNIGSPTCLGMAFNETKEWFPDKEF